MVRPAALAAIATVWLLIGQTVSAYDARRFMTTIVNEDRYWADTLDVAVRIDTKLLGRSAVELLQDLGAVEPKRDGGGSDAPPSTTVVTAIALDVIVEAVTVRYHNSDAVQLAMSVFVSAIKCHALRLIAAQVNAIGAAGNERLEEKITWLTAVLSNLISYMDKLARLRDPLTGVSDLYAEWLKVIGGTTPPGGDSGDGGPSVANTDRMSRLIDDEANGACEANTSGWQRVEGDGGVTFAETQERLDKFLGDLKIGAMGDRIWEDVLNVRELLSVVNPALFDYLIQTGSQTVARQSAADDKNAAAGDIIRPTPTQLGIDIL